VLKVAKPCYCKVNIIPNNHPTSTGAPML